MYVFPLTGCSMKVIERVIKQIYGLNFLLVVNATKLIKG